MKPKIPITSKYFKYVPAINTDIRTTFENHKKNKQEEAFVEIFGDLVVDLQKRMREVDKELLNSSEAT